MFLQPALAADSGSAFLDQTGAASVLPLLLLLLTTALLFGLYRLIIYQRQGKELTHKIIELQNALITSQKELEDMKKEKHRQLDPYSSPNTKSLFLCINKDGKIVSVNDYANEFFGYEKEELVGKNVVGTLVPPKDSHGQVLSNLIDRIKNNPRLYVDNENENICKDGRKVWISWTNRIIYGPDGLPAEIRSVGFDITPRKQLEEELRQMTIIDPVTGVLNKRQFLDDGTKEMKRARRYKRDLSVLLMTIDRFETLSSEHGTAFGDEAIRVAVIACQSSIRDSDYLGRMADIEFAILLPETPLEGAKIVAERIRDEVMRSNLMVGDVKIAVTTSISIASRTEADETIDAVLLRAFNALRSAKKRQNNIAVAEEPSA
ncbi:MAG: GGDEF domain-containing protein [Alphaproteobacteria bacterium]|nr:GGDEF domain-containing protein [Alphaproteobacteria bacterium]